MIKVAIVGNIASGKTEFEKYLFKNDYVVFDTDVMAHDILIDKPEIVSVEDCVKVSELINPILDKEDPIDGSYVLDVSSIERG